MKIHSYILWAALVLLKPFLGFSQSEQQIESTLQQYKQCLMQADEKLIPSIIDDSFRFGIYQQPYSRSMFETFLKKMAAPDSVYWEKSEKENERLVYYVYGEDEAKYLVTFATSGKLLFSDWLDVKGAGFHRRKASEFVAAIPFELKDGKIIIPARLNGTSKQLRMMFDTGADGMALVAEHQEACQVKTTRNQNANVPGGQMQVRLSDNNTLQLDSLSIPNQSMAIFPKIVDGVDGIIGGANLFRNYITQVDFDKQLITLYTFGQFSPAEPYQGTSMSYAGGIPTVPIRIYKDNKKFESNFILDTGAGYAAILFGSGMKILEKENIGETIVPKYYSYNYSMGHRSQIGIGQTDSISFAHMCFGNALFAMEPYKASSHSRHNVLGSIGIKSLSKFNWIVDLTAYQVYSAPNQASELPMDFVFEGHLLGYDHTTLKVIRPTEKGANEALKKGNVISSFGQVKAENLNQQKLQKILQQKKVKLKLKAANGEEQKMTIQQEAE